MERVLKWLGYREKTSGVDDILREAQETTQDSKLRMKRIRATLNGEDKWFLSGDCFGGLEKNDR